MGYWRLWVMRGDFWFWKKVWVIIYKGLWYVNYTAHSNKVVPTFQHSRPLSASAQPAHNRTRNVANKKPISIDHGYKIFSHPQFKMQFKVIASILLFFVAQTMATPSPQRDKRVNYCTLPFTAKGQN